MLQLIRIRFLRWLIGVIVPFKWRGKIPQGVDTAPVSIDCGDHVVPARVFTPHGAKGPLPVLLYFHGGGWIGFDVDTHDPLCRDLCVKSGMLVVSVDYRLAPEHPFPAGAHDCLDALDWLKANVARFGGDPQRILVGGDSAGGNLAAVVTLQARDRHPGLIKGQVLIYPATDHPSHTWPSHVSHGGKGYPLTHAGLKDLWRTYLKGSAEWKAGQTQHDLATPYRVADVSGLPRTIVVIANDDVLRDEGLAYAERMREAGAEVTVKRFPGEKHGFVGLQPTPAHAQAVQDIASWVHPLHISAGLAG